MDALVDLNVPGFEEHRGFAIVKATSEELFGCVARLRYHIYVTIMNRTQVHADHAERTIREPLDLEGTNYLAIYHGRMIGTIRRNRLNNFATEYYRRLYQAELFVTAPSERTAITTKLMMLPEFQGSRLAAQLIKHYAVEQYADGVQVDVIDCNQHLIPFFEKLGYFSYIGWVTHKEYGKVMPMFLAQDAVGYLKRIGSLLAPVAEAAVVDNAYGGYELIRSLAQQPTLEFISDASKDLRSPVGMTDVGAS